MVGLKWDGTVACQARQDGTSSNNALPGNKTRTCDLNHQRLDVPVCDTLDMAIADLAESKCNEGGFGFRSRLSSGAR